MRKKAGYGKTMKKAKSGSKVKKAGYGKSMKAKAGKNLKKPTAKQVGLKKLPTAVRNKMGYMMYGGKAKKRG